MEKNMEENKNNEVLEETKPVETRSSTRYFINLIILVMVSAFFVLGLSFNLASLHFLYVYTHSSYNTAFYNISCIFLVLDVLSTLGLGVDNFVIVFVSKTRDDKKRNTIYVIIAISILTLLILIRNLL